MWTLESVLAMAENCVSRSLLRPPQPMNPRLMRSLAANSLVVPAVALAIPATAAAFSRSRRCRLLDSIFLHHSWYNPVFANFSCSSRSGDGRLPGPGPAVPPPGPAAGGRGDDRRHRAGAVVA